MANLPKDKLIIVRVGKRQKGKGKRRYREDTYFPETKINLIPEKNFLNYCINAQKVTDK